MESTSQQDDSKKLPQVQEQSGQVQQSPQVQLQVQNQNNSTQPQTPQSQPNQEPQTLQTTYKTTTTTQLKQQAQTPSTIQIQPSAQVVQASTTLAQVGQPQQIQLQQQPSHQIQKLSQSPQIQQLTPTNLAQVSTSQALCTIPGTTPPIVFQLTHPPRGVIPTTTQIRPQGTLTLTPTTATTVVQPPTVVTQQTIIKAEPNKYICCLLDNGIRCDRIAGNASFSARIQKIVGTKKMNFALDPTVRHAYICEHHKAIITVAKKSTTIARETKANAKNYNTHANSMMNTNASLATSAVANNVTYTATDLSRRQPTSVTVAPPPPPSTTQQVGDGITTLQHPVNLELITNPNQRLGNNNHLHHHHHPGGPTLSTIPIVRQGTQIAYGHYQPGAVHPNQFVNMDVLMTNNKTNTNNISSFDNTGGDNVINNIGPSSSSGIGGGSNVGNASSNNTGIDVDLQQLQVNTLRRYKRHFRVQTKPGLNKMQLAESLKSHFRTLPIIEKEAITYFVYIVKCYRNKLDNNPAAD